MSQDDAGTPPSAEPARTPEAPVASPDRPDTTPEGPATPDAPGATPAPAILTQDDDGSRVSLALGGEVALRLGSDWSWSEPAFDGDAVVLTPVDYFDDPGFVEWLVTGASPGRTTLRAEGVPACDDPAACPARELAIEVVVTG